MYKLVPKRTIRRIEGIAENEEFHNLLAKYSISSRNLVATCYDLIECISSSLIILICSICIFVS